MASPIVSENPSEDQGPGRTPARHRSPEYEQRDKLARAQGFASYWHKRKAMEAGRRPELDGRRPEWRAPRKPRKARRAA